MYNAVTNRFKQAKTIRSGNRSDVTKLFRKIAEYRFLPERINRNNKVNDFEVK